MATKAATKTKKTAAPKAKIDFFASRFGESTHLREARPVHGTHGPGMPFRFHSGMSYKQAHRQGDLYLTLRDPKDRPVDYVEVSFHDNDPKYLQLVPGLQQGARHCLDSLSGVRMWLPSDFGPDSLRGPWISITKERVVRHPTHGHSELIPGIGDYNCTYQRSLDSVLKLERRNAD